MSELPEKHQCSESDVNMQLDGTDGLIKQEQNIVIGSYGSIVGMGETVEGSSTRSITITDGFEKETIKIEEPVNIKREAMDNSMGTIPVENPKYTDPVVIVPHGSWAAKKEDDIDAKTESTNFWEVHDWNDETKAELESNKDDNTPNHHMRIKNMSDQMSDVHSPDRPYSCAMCDKSFTQKFHLKRHSFLHTGKKPYSCTVCGKSFTQKYKLTQHNLLHTGEKPYSCTECGKSFTQKSSLTQHNLLHTGQKHMCTVCGKSFIRKSHLTRHSLLHTGEKPYSCTECGKSFARKSTLTLHSRLHTGEKSYIWTESGKSFIWKSHLTEHSLSHTGEKPFSCTECGKSYRHKRSLTKHSLSHTGKKTY